jgi:hypothetical protein
MRARTKLTEPSLTEPSPTNKNSAVDAHSAEPDIPKSNPQISGLKVRRQYTEGVGEMVEGQDHWITTGVRFGISVSRLHPRRRKPKMKPDLRPADAPCRHLSRPVSADRRSTSTKAGPCDAIFNTCDAEDRSWRDYFFFRRFAAFLATFFAFLFFAIAALLA